MGGRCPFAFLRSPSALLPSVRKSFVPSVCHRPLSSTIWTMAVHCTGLYGPNLMSIRTIILGVLKQPFFQEGMWKRSLHFARMAAGKASL